MKFWESTPTNKGVSREVILEPLHTESMQTFRDEIATLHIKGPDKKDINVLHLTGPDRLMWEEFKSRNTIDQENFGKYYAEVEMDGIDATFGSPRYSFAQYLLGQIENSDSGPEPIPANSPLTW